VKIEVTIDLLKTVGRVDHAERNKKGAEKRVKKF
jgi:hypothetical protein